MNEVRLAALDVGTNTVLMLVVEAAPDGSVRRLRDLARITRIGRGVDRNGALDPEAAQRTLETIVEFAAVAREAGAQKILAVATSALRDARDGESFIAQVRELAGVNLEVIPGRTEAELSHLAVVRGLQINPDVPLLITDIGGGSTELIRCEPEREMEMVSLQIGSVRLTERFIRRDPPSPDERQRLADEIDSALHGLGWNFTPGVLVGIAGTVTTICALSLELETYDSGRVHGHVLSLEDVSRTLARLGELPLPERRKLKGLEPGRADVIFAGGVILERIMKHFGVSRVTVSDQGVRWGLVWRELKHVGLAN